MHKTSGKRLVNLPFTKSLHSLEHSTWHHFPRMKCSRWCRQTQFSSTTELSNEIRWHWSRGCRHFLSLVYLGVDACFVFGFVVFYLWVNSDNIICWQTWHTGSFQIPCLGSCPLLTNQKILLISLTKYMISGQSDTEADLIPDPYRFVWIRFQINHFCFSEKYADFIHRQGASDYKVHRSDWGWGGVGSIIVALSRPKITVAYALFRIHSALHWLDLHGWDDTEFEGRSSADWCGRHLWAVTCLICVVILHTVTQWCG